MLDADVLAPRAWRALQRICPSTLLLSHAIDACERLIVERGFSLHALVHVRLVPYSINALMTLALIHMLITSLVE